jgi:hypothetical protein
MLQCYVLTCGRSVTAFLVPPRSRRPGQLPRSPHPKAGPGPEVNQRLTEMSNRNISGGGGGGGCKGGRCVELATLPPSCADCLEICEP